MINQMMAIEITNMSNMDIRYNFEVDETMNALIVRIAEYLDGQYILTGNAMILNKNMKEFRTGAEFKLIDNNDIKAELIALACKYCNLDTRERGDSKWQYLRH